MTRLGLINLAVLLAPTASGSSRDKSSGFDEDRPSGRSAVQKAPLGRVNRWLVLVGPRKRPLRAVVSRQISPIAPLERSRRPRGIERQLSLGVKPLVLRRKHERQVSLGVRLLGFRTSVSTWREIFGISDIARTSGQSRREAFRISNVS